MFSTLARNFLLLAALLGCAAQVQASDASLVLVQTRAVQLEGDSSLVPKEFIGMQTLDAESSTLSSTSKDFERKKERKERRPKERGLTGKVPQFSHVVVWWLHIPKCGSSFKFSVKTAVQSRTRQNTQHQKLEDSDDARQVVGMFREPAQRLASAFTHLRQDKACCGGDWGWRPEVRHQAQQELKRHENIASSGFLQSFHGCQTNMILGRGCMSREEISNEDLKKAFGLVDKFFFVGLETEWLLSVCLFNYFTTGRRFVEQFQLFDNRPTSGVSGQTHSKYDTTGYEVDHADTSLYHHVQQRFRSDLKTHAVNEKTCTVTHEYDELIPEYFKTVDGS